MSVTKREARDRLLTGLVDEDLAIAYQKLLDRGQVTCAEAAETVGGEEVLSTLANLGLAHPATGSPTAAAGYAATRPDLAIQAILTREQDEVGAGYQKIRRGLQRLIDVQACSHTAAALPEQLIKVSTDSDEITSLSATMINNAKHDWMTLETHHHELPLRAEHAAPVPEALRTKIRIRAIYDLEFARDPVGDQIIQRSIDMGERARILEAVPMKMKLADTTIAMLPLTPTGTRGAVSIRAEPILQALREYFELLWERATPYGTELRVQPQSGLSDAERRILELAVRGLSDEAMARHEKVHVSTVRRHLKDICQRLNVTSRFAAGVAVQKKGWLKDDTEAA